MKSKHEHSGVNIDPGTRVAWLMLTGVCAALPSAGAMSTVLIADGILLTPRLTQQAYCVLKKVGLI